MPLIALHDITKSYGAVKALEGVSMHLHRGEVRTNSVPTRFTSPLDAQAQKIGTVGLPVQDSGGPL